MSFLARAFRTIANKQFDAKFYLSHYEDLRSLKTAKQAIRHYREHGKAEGRFPTRAAYEANTLALRAGFDLGAYKFHNRDLANRFSTDDEFFNHYVTHGHAEGRTSRFAEETRSDAIVAEAEKWKSAFSTSHFLAWCGDELSPLPTAREQALAAFIEHGVARLWPINLEYIFDPAFVRSHGLLPRYRNASDAELYLGWLTEGFPAGIAPNERLFLAPYLGGAPFPSDLDCEALRQIVGAPRNATRAEVLITLFEQPSHKILDATHSMGEQAAWLLGRIGLRSLGTGHYAKARTLLERSVNLSPEPALLSALGTAWHAQGNAGEALAAHRAAIELGEAPLDAHLQVASILASHHDFAGAFASLRQAHVTWRKEAQFGQKLDDLVQMYFDHQSSHAHALYRALPEQPDPRTRQVADDLLTATLDTISTVYLELGRMPVRTGGVPDGDVVILANDNIRQCTHYRIEQKARAFEAAGIKVRVFSESETDAFKDSLIGARAAIFYRVGAVPQVLRAILMANAIGLETWYEVDDAIFDSDCYPDSFASFEGQLSAGEYAGLQFGVPLFRYAMSRCKMAIASTPALLERMMRVVISADGFVLRNGLDDRNAIHRRLGACLMRDTNGPVRLFYGSGTKAHNLDFNRLVAPALAELMGRYPKLELVIVGHLLLGPEITAFEDRVIRHPFIPDLTQYWSLLSACDINIAALESSPSADCKSEIKWLEAAILQVPSVVSGTRTFREVVDDGCDGLIADTADQWLEKLQQLIEQPALRNRIGSAARTKALRNYDISVAAERLKAAFGPRDQSERKHSANRLRVLICNVFYAPQSYGGATRVVQDNVRAYIENFDDLDVAVFCSDEGAEPAGRLRMDNESGVPVYRLATRPRASADWMPFDDATAAPFERVLNHFKPDIIHFHCVQRLTGTIVEIALARDIPYIVTLHDGWWISDHQFFVDPDGLLHMPGRNVMVDTGLAPDPLASLDRRQRLSSLLRSATATTTVSGAFAKIYADAGIEGALVIENGASPITTVPRDGRSDGRIALGHIGGRTTHKGAPLVEAVLRRGHFARLHLTMVDGNLSPGEEIETVWGSTPVTLLGPYPQSQIAQLYSRLDVLLAPSTWPESFGLVTREAAIAGLWVVASNLGALGDDIEDGHNGRIIDVATPHELAAALAEIDAEPWRFSTGTNPPRSHGLADSHSPIRQASSFHELYRDIVAAARSSGSVNA